MPTFYDPVADAEEASQALRGLAHASRDFTHPEDAYGVIGDLLAGVRSMQQSIQQLATRHARHDGRAFDDAGDPAAGIRDARLAAGELSEAAAALDRVEEGLNRASQAAGRIAWHPAPPAPAETEMTRVQGPVSRWVNIVFLQGGEADAQSTRDVLHQLRSLFGIDMVTDDAPRESVADLARATVARWRRSRPEGPEGRGPEVEVVRALRTVGRVQDQSRLTRAGRRRNLAGHVAVRAGVFAGDRPVAVVLFDDVVTTGATAAECVAVLAAGGLPVTAVLAVTAA